MNDLDKALAELLSGVPAVTVPKVNNKYHAVVLQVHEVTCDTCGCVAHMPNKHLLVEYEMPNKTLVLTHKVTKSHIDDLPRRIDHVPQQVPVCEHCFEDAKLIPQTGSEGEKGSATRRGRDLDRKLAEVQEEYEEDNNA